MRLTEKLSWDALGDTIAQASSVFEHVWKVANNTVCRHHKTNFQKVNHCQISYSIISLVPIARILPTIISIAAIQRLRT